MKHVIDLNKHTTPKPAWTGYTIRCTDGAWYVGVTFHPDACWRLHANKEHPFTRQHRPKTVAVRHVGQAKAEALMWQRQTIARLKRLLPYGTLIGSNRGRTQLAKREVWQVRRTPRVKKSSKLHISTVPLSSL